MIVIVDGKIVKCNNDVTIIQESQLLSIDMADMSNIDGELHITATPEGIILDTILNGEAIETAALQNDDLIELCH